MSMNIKHTFPSIETVLKFYLTTPCTNCSSERSFSALKRVKTRLRSFLSQDRLDNLTLLTDEHEITKQLTFDDIIDEFSKDPRKKSMLLNVTYNLNIIYKIKYTFLNKIINNFI